MAQKKKETTDKLLILYRDFFIHTAYHSFGLNPTDIEKIFTCSRPTVYAVLNKRKVDINIKKIKQ